jgi:peptide/nickel transport system ATP-binding protein
VVAELADDVLVMYGGKCLEYGAATTVFEQPEHPYTWGLLGSMPRMDRAVTDRLLPIKGTPPSLINLPKGCPFSPRCRYARDRCRAETPPLIPAETPDHLYACWYPVGSPEYHERRRELDEAPVSVGAPAGATTDVQTFEDVS